MRAADAARHASKLSSEEAEAISALAKARQPKKRPTKPGKMPNDGAEFVWRTLSHDDKQLAMAAAIKRFDEIGIPHEFRQYQDIESEVFLQMLHLAMRDPCNVELRSFAYSAAELRQYLTTDERDILSTQLLDFEEEHEDPSIDELTDAEFDAVLDTVKKNDRQRSISYGSNMLFLCLRTLVSQLETSTISSSSSGSSPSAAESQPEASK